MAPCTIALPPAPISLQEAETPSEPPSIGASDVQASGALIGIDFTDEEIELMLDDVRGRLGEFAALRRDSIPNHVPPAGTFSPFVPGVLARSAAGMAAFANALGTIKSLNTQSR